ncbi:hypothetical protein [Aeoliella mucimassa]|uniref:DUF3352 domain-containing protein n=1 Tax=Aeoliella mucimassa TaxID=2527972 RepID=A0A518AIL7_9BACT|nr:hypothetical protein [Aeoliella mucimassa]QDU54581.1 hypothetical protein Pan181_07640 [Aeoliella mucimassa]
MMRSISRYFILPMAALAMALAPALSGSTASAADMRDHAQSLNGVPQDAAFYAAWVKNRQQIEVITQSNAWKKLMSIPLVQMGWMQAQTQWQYPTEPEVVKFKKWFDSDEGQDVYALVTEMLSDEVFVYGDESLASLIDVAMQMNSEVSRAQFQSLREYGTERAEDMDEVLQEKLTELLDEYEDDLDVPTVVMGFRIQDRERAVKMLDLAATRLRQAMEQESEIPAWVAEQLERRQVNGHEMLILTITGEQLPWDEIERDMADAPEFYEELREVVEGKTLVLTAGIVEEFVVFAVTDSIEMFEHLGESELLVDSEAFSTLNKHADEQITTIGYASEYFMQSLASQELSFGDMKVMASGLISMVGVDEDRMKAIDKDLSDLFDDIIDYLPEPGAVAGVSFMTDRGIESYTYNWGEMPATVDGTQKLTLLDHLGSDSLGWFVTRGKQSPEGYEKFVNYFLRGLGHFEAIAEEKASEEEWDEYKTVRDEVMPLLAKLDEANRNYLIPGFADGQSALVLDASIADKEWCDFMSPAQSELPMPTLAIVSGVSDSDAVKSGAKIYFDVIQTIIDKAHEANPEEVPPFVLPAPDSKSTSTGTIYSYNQLATLGANERVAPNAGLSDSVLVLSVLPELTEKLLDGSKPELEGPAAEFDRPLASAGYFSFAKAIDLSKPWIDYGIQMVVEQAGEDGSNVVMTVGLFKGQFDQLLDILKVMDSYTGVSYKEGDAWVNHGELRLIDLED